ncbi:LuxR family transcriptional regulator [Variovorax sp. JS1663]|uniref:LuxR family transcriptional regulator n=1 Tax=Variovorax sp. JS1663 TaxID=1851577 RepID=UPI00117C9044|nr:LuxR family transcriptional regulator [Variovorax sp. JS1663]
MFRVPQTVLVENRPGAGGTIGNAFVVKAPADGYTVLIGITSLILQPSLMDKLPYDPLKDLAPVTMIARSLNMLAVPLDSPAGDLKSFVAMVRANPGKYSIGNYGIGTYSHIQGALFNMQTGVAPGPAGGAGNKLIARALDLSPHTVKRRVARILDRLDLASRMQAAGWYRTYATH